MVDGANVVGSVPDGWWRDRAGAAARLRDKLIRARLPYDEVVLVLEGKARAGVPVGAADGVTTVHAPGEGDDEIVERCREAAATAAVTLASADRGLLARVEPFGVAVLGPGTLRSQIEGA